MKQRTPDQILNSFARISGLKIALIDSRFRGLAVSGHDAGKYCALLHTSHKCLEICLQSNLSAFYHVQKTGELYQYQCPFGLGEAIAPIQDGDSAVGYLIIGPFIENDCEKQLLKRVAEHAPDQSEEKLKKEMAKLKRCSQEDVQAYCDMLAAVAFYIECQGYMGKCEKTIGQLVKAYIKRNLSQKITLAELSLHVHCSTVTLTEHFRREFGMTVMQYVMKKRMELAARLLLQTQLAVTDIASQCGFCDAEYFTRCFKRAYGVCPSGFRRRTEAQSTETTGKGLS